MPGLRNLRMIASPRTCSLTLLAVILLSSLQAIPARASVDDIVWDGPPEIAALGVETVPSAAGTSAVFWNDQWRVVYEEGDVVFMISRTSSGWSAPVEVSSGAVRARDPRIAATASAVHVIWQDERSGCPEIWTRRFNGSTWSSQQCLSLDAVTSRSGVIAANDLDAFVAWEDSSAGGFRVWARTYHNNAWEPTEAISDAAARGREPTVTYNWGTSGFLCAWTDYADAVPRIMLWGLWSAEFLTYGTEPSIHAEPCCGDAIVEADFHIVFQAQGTAGAPELYDFCYRYSSQEVYPLSADDGIASSNGLAAGFPFAVSPCYVPGGALPRYLSSWTDATGGGFNTHWIADGCAPDADRQILSNAGKDRCAIAIASGDPARVLAYWIEMRSDVPALMARGGHLTGCYTEEIALPPAIVLAPEGIPANLFHAFESCSDRPLARFDIWIEFEDELDAALTWAPLQTHPSMWMETDSSGDALFAILGGGCSQAGRAWGGCGWNVWSGAKSPDVDGDCVVRLNDLQYVQARLGSADFCADLDGSGVVDQADVDIVTSTLGDHCSNQSTDVDDDGDAQSIKALRTSLTLGPTPASGEMTMRLVSLRETTAEVSILNAEGRIVRAIGRVNVHPGDNAIRWDSRDDEGRLVASGIYFAVARMDGQALKRVVVVTR
ncbi:MAG: hypothetical protein KBD56_06295 [Candidatus Eisenbacteria bacterium]|nr:hypothetical protein [Candidatus Eisenbacteria bacterium]